MLRLNIPDTCLVNKAVPKTAFYRFMDINAKMKKHFVDDVESICWTYKIAPSTLNVADGETVHEITVFHVTLKYEQCPQDVFRFIDENMPRHILFVIQHKERYCLMVNYKQWKDDKTFTITQSFASPWVKADEVALVIEGQTMDRLYDNLVAQISGIGQHESGSLEKIVELKAQLKIIENEMDSLKKRMAREKQFSVQCEMNNKIKQLRKEIASINDELNVFKHI